MTQYQCRPGRRRGTVTVTGVQGASLKLRLRRPPPPRPLGNLNLKPAGTRTRTAREPPVPGTDTVTRDRARVGAAAAAGPGSPHCCGGPRPGAGGQPLSAVVGPGRPAAAATVTITGQLGHPMIRTQAWRRCSSCSSYRWQPPRLRVSHSD